MGGGLKIASYPSIPNRAGKLRTYNNGGSNLPVQFFFTVPDHLRWRVKSLRFTISTDLPAATARRAYIQISPGALTLRTDVRATQAGLQTRSYNFIPTARDQTAFANAEIQTPLPDELILPAGASLEINTTPAIPTDSLDSAFLLVEEWIDG